MRNLPRLRRACEFSQLRLAAKANISPYRLSMAEGGLLDLTACEVGRLREILEPALVELMGLIQEFQTMPTEELPA